jgi:hypothetical protein
MNDLGGIVGHSKHRIDFFLAGVQKGGTTALAEALAHHPSLRMANRKEVHFFDDSRLDWKNPEYEVYHRWFQPTKSTAIMRGEATPIYFYQPQALRRIYRYNPQSKFIICLRHPSFRAHSHWRMETARGLETWRFSRAISAEGRARILSGDQNSRIFSYVERGLYAQQFRRLFTLFPRSHVHILRTDHLWLNNHLSLGGIWNFLGVEPPGEKAPRLYIVPSDSRAVGRMLSADRRYLDTLFGPDIMMTRNCPGRPIE